jgi:hypothetical protein
MRPTSLLSLPLVLALLFASASAKDFVWPGHGTISFDVPLGWTIRGGQNNQIAFGFQADPDSHAAAVIQLVLFDTDATHPVTEEFVKNQIETMSKPYVAGSVEKAISLKPLKPSQGFGWYTEFTDASLVGKPPVPKNYKIARNALIGLEEHALTVAVLEYDDPAGPEAAAMMAILTGMRFKRGTAESDPAIHVTEVGENYLLTVAVSKVTLKIPKQGLVQSGMRVGGSTNSPRYFELERSSPNLIVSGWFESADGFHDIKTFWNNESKGLAKSGLPAPANVTFLQQGKWEVVAYEIPLAKATNANLRAELKQAGTWIDLHLSSTSNLTVAEARTQLLAALATFEIQQK